MPHAAELDILIIGAGAAGLAAAADLTRAGPRVTCPEARDRIGGRIHTVHHGHAIELGPEFIHGHPPEIFDLVHSAGLHAIETGGRMLHVLGGNVTEAPEGGAVLDDLKHSATPDRDESFEAFL